MADGTDYMDIREAATQWDVSEKTVERYIGRGVERGDDTRHGVFQHHQTGEFVQFRAWKTMSKSGLKWRIEETGRTREKPEGVEVKERPKPGETTLATRDLLDLRDVLTILADNIQDQKRALGEMERIRRRNVSLEHRLRTRNEEVEALKKRIGELAGVGERVPPWAGTILDPDIQVRYDTPTTEPVTPEPDLEPDLEPQMEPQTGEAPPLFWQRLLPWRRRGR